MADHNHGGTPSADLKFTGPRPSGWFRYVPLFLFIVVIYLLAKPIVTNPNAALALGKYQVSWVMVLMVLASIVALVEQMKVSHPGIDNTMEALGMIGMGVLQLMLFVLGAANVGFFRIFANTEFLVLTFISLAAAVVAVLINARTLRRTIGVGDT